MKALVKLNSLFAVLLIAASCGADKPHPTQPANIVSTQEAAFIAMMPTSEMNDFVTLRFSSEFTKDSTIGSLITLYIENQSRETIIFPLDYGVALFIYSEQEGSWQKLGDRNTYIGSKKHLLVPKGEADPATNSVWQQIVSTQPDVSNTGQPVIVRVVVIGNIYKDGKETSEQVGAYTDITLQP